MKPREEIKFIDLFAGIGAFRLGFENACIEVGLKPRCVLTSEIKKYAITTYQANFEEHNLSGDISLIDPSKVGDFDILLAGFPCQAFSAAGKRDGFADTRGTLFFEIERILEFKRPKGFILENVEGLVAHDRKNPKDKIGRTLTTILTRLENLGYSVSWKVLNAVDFGVPQNRKRIFIVGALNAEVSLEGFESSSPKLHEVLQNGLPVIDTKLSRLLTKTFSQAELEGKAIKDKRGGSTNIHSWDIALKGKVSQSQKRLLEALLRARRSKKWAVGKGIDWMDGMPLTLREIQSFCDEPNLKKMLEDLVDKGYLSFEHPKEIKHSTINGRSKTLRVPKVSSEKGYNIVSGKLSFDINLILDPKSISPTLVATDLSRIAVSEKNGLRPLSDLELLRLFGLPDDFKLVGSATEKADLIGNTVVVPVVEKIAIRLVEVLFKDIDHSSAKYKVQTDQQLQLFR